MRKISTYSKTPGLINNALNEANATNFSSGFTLGSNISEKLDFTFSYSSNYNIVKNTIQSDLNSNYFYQVTTAKVNLLPWKGLVLNTDVSYYTYSGLGSAYNQNYLLWNAGIGYKFLKDNAGELRLTAFDLLKQNNSISRSVTETYIEDSQVQVLQRYFLLTFTYTLRKFKAKRGA